MLHLRVWNVSDLAPVSDYVYEVDIGGEFVTGGKVKGHARADGWPELVRRIVESHLAATRTLVACGAHRADGAICVVGLRRPGEEHKHKWKRPRPA